MKKYEFSVKVSLEHLGSFVYCQEENGKGDYYSKTFVPDWFGRPEEIPKKVKTKLIKTLNNKL